jgi:hypothetical protein
MPERRVLSMDSAIREFLDGLAEMIADAILEEEGGNHADGGSIRQVFEREAEGDIH